MFCTSCGTRLDDQARFCLACGKPSSGQASSGQASSGQARTPGMAQGEQTAAPTPHKLRRVLALKKVAGVCAGFAEYFGMDLTLMRLIWVALLLIPPNIGILAYIIAWAVLPKE